MRRCVFISAFASVLILIAVCMTGCGGTVGIHSGGGGGINCAGCGSTGSGGSTGGSGSATSGPVTVTVLDPPTCASPRGNFNHIYMSISGVQLNPDANATASSTGWVDVAPALATSPKQIDLLNAGASVGNLLSATTAAGTYGSLRLLLAPDTATVSNNQCGSNGAHCAMNGSTTLPISTTAAENTQGIVVNSSDIFGASVAVDSAGSNINILFDSCSSLISTNIGYRLLPNVVAWGGAIQTYNFTVADGVSQARLGAGTAIVALEKADSKGADRIWASATPNATGIATIYAPQGTFDAVAVATGVSGGAQTIYSPLVMTGVTGTGSAVSTTLNLVPQGVASPGTIVHGVAADVPIDARISVRQNATIASVQTQPFTIPVMDANGATVPVGLTASCPEACEVGSVQVPSQPLYVQAFGSSTQTVSSSPIVYTLFATPFVSRGAGAKDCTTAAYGTSVDLSGAPLSPAPGLSQSAAPLTFTGCQ